MWLWQANLGRGEIAEFQRNFDRLYRRGGPRAVYNLQEIDEADKPEEMDYIRRAVSQTHHVMGDELAVPILVPHHLRILNFKQTLGCGGVAELTPHRPIPQVTLQVGGLEIVGHNGHMPRLWPETVPNRQQFKATLKSVCRDDENGWWTLDTNTHKGWPTIVPGEKSVIDAGIDKTKAWGNKDKKIRVLLGKERFVPLNIDGHNGHGRQVWWEAA